MPLDTPRSTGKAWEATELARFRTKQQAEFNQRVAAITENIRLDPLSQSYGWVWQPLREAFVQHVREITDEWIRLRRKIAGDAPQWALNEELKALTEGMRAIIEQQKADFVACCTSSGLKRAAPRDVEREAAVMTREAERVWCDVAMACKSLNQEIAPILFGDAFREARDAAGDDQTTAAQAVDAKSRKTVYDWERHATLPGSRDDRKGQAESYIAEKHPEGSKVLGRIVWRTSH